MKTTPCHIPNSEKPPKHSHYTLKNPRNLWQSPKVGFERVPGLPDFARRAHSVTRIPPDLRGRHKQHLRDAAPRAPLSPRCLSRLGVVSRKGGDRQPSALAAAGTECVARRGRAARWTARGRRDPRRLACPGPRPVGVRGGTLGPCTAMRRRTSGWCWPSALGVASGVLSGCWLGS